MLWEIQVLKKCVGSSWYWRIVSACNGKTICHSETYVNKYAALKTARRLQQYLKYSRVSWKMKNGEWYLVG